MRRLLRRIAVVELILSLAPMLCTSASADGLGSVRALPEDPGAHWVWIGDLVLRRSALMDRHRAGEIVGIFDTHSEDGESSGCSDGP